MATQDAGDLIHILHSESKCSNDDELAAIAQFANDGGYVEIQGEDRDDLFRMVFRGGKLKRVKAIISFPEDQEFDY